MLEYFIKDEKWRLTCGNLELHYQKLGIVVTIDKENRITVQKHGDVTICRECVQKLNQISEQTGEQVVFKELYPTDKNLEIVNKIVNTSLMNGDVLRNLDE